MCKTSDTATNKGKPTQVPRQDVGAPPAGAGELAVERGGDMADGEVFTAATGQELVVSTGILGDLVVIQIAPTRSASCSGARRPENGVLLWFLDHQAARTDSGRPRSSIRLRTVTAIRVSTSWAGRVCERKVSPMMRLYRLIAPSAPALAL
jgi:hypothetical protein